MQTGAECATAGSSILNVRFENAGGSICRELSCTAQRNEIEVRRAASRAGAGEPVGVAMTF